MTSISPDKIIQHGKILRRKVERLRQTYGTSHPAISEVFSMADDICELVIALAENQLSELANFEKETENGRHTS